MTPLAFLLYAIAMTLGAWNAARLWRASPRPHRGRCAALVLLAAALFLAGASLRGGLAPSGAPRLDRIAFAAGVVLMLLGLGAILAACRRPYAGRRRFLLLGALGVLLLAAAHTVNVLPRVQRQGLRAGIPTTALVIAWPWLPKGAQDELAGASSREMHPWQRSLLRRRCAGIISSSTDRSLVGAAAALMPAGPASVAAPLLLTELFTDYCSADRAAADRAAEFLFVSLTTRFIPERFDDATSRTLLPIVRSGLEGSDASTARRCAWTVERLGPHAEPLLPTLERLVRSPQADLDPLPRAALSALAALARESDAAWRSFIPLVDDPNDKIQLAVLHELLDAGFRPRSPEIIARVLPLLEDPSDALAGAVTTTLLFICADPCAAAGPILARARKGPTDEVAVRAVRRLAEHCPSEALHDLIARMLATPDTRTQRFAIDACAALGASAQRHRAALLQLAGPESPDPSLPAPAAAALRGIDSSRRE